MKKLFFAAILFIFIATESNAQQDGMLGEVKLFAGNFAPRGWALCHGQLLPINSNTALFSILGTTYGGDGRTTFQLPDLRSRVPVGAGTSPGLPTTRLGYKFGAPTTNLPLTASIPQIVSIPVHEVNPDGEKLVKGNSALLSVGNAKTSSLLVKGESKGNSIPVNNLQPSLGMNYIICLVGTFPSRN
ncbi:phage tail protein [Polaribacter sp.]|uniref:phage tail protein n=1 Tax=Polaribacter sp. TaxID=1920175 RepID=UPI003EFAC2D7